LTSGPTPAAIGSTQGTPSRSLTPPSSRVRCSADKVAVFTLAPDAADRRVRQPRETQVEIDARFERWDRILRITVEDVRH